MQVFRVDQSGARLAVPMVIREEQCYSFFHGVIGARSYGYALRLGREAFPVRPKGYAWDRVHFRLQSTGEQDELKSSVYVLTRGSSTSHCICLLDFASEEGRIGSLAHRNKHVHIIGRGEEGMELPKCGGARRWESVEYPVLCCTPGAQFSWQQKARRGYADYVAWWDGGVWKVQLLVPLELLPRHAEAHLATRGWLRL